MICVDTTCKKASWSLIKTVAFSRWSKTLPQLHYFKFSFFMRWSLQPLVMTELYRRRRTQLHHSCFLSSSWRVYRNTIQSNGWIWYIQTSCSNKFTKPNVILHMLQHLSVINNAFGPQSLNDCNWDGVSSSCPPVSWARGSICIDHHLEQRIHIISVSKWRCKGLTRTVPESTFVVHATHNYSNAHARHELQRRNMPSAKLLADLDCVCADVFMWVHRQQTFFTPIPFPVHMCLLSCWNECTLNLNNVYMLWLLKPYCAAACSKYAIVMYTE